MELCNKYQYAFMATNIAKTLVDKGLMHDEPHYSQDGYNLVGQEAGLTMAQYVNGRGN